jgi:hypothetical protein
VKWSNAIHRHPHSPTLVHFLPQIEQHPLQHHIETPTLQLLFAAGWAMDQAFPPLYLLGVPPALSCVPANDLSVVESFVLWRCLGFPGRHGR